MTLLKPNRPVATHLWICEIDALLGEECHNLLRHGLQKHERESGERSRFHVDELSLALARA